MFHGHIFSKFRSYRLHELCSGNIPGEFRCHGMYELLCWHLSSLDGYIELLKLSRGKVHGLIKRADM